MKPFTYNVWGARKGVRILNARAQNSIGVMYSEGRGVVRDDADGIRWYRLAAEQGHLGLSRNRRGSLVQRTGRDWSAGLPGCAAALAAGGVRCETRG